MGLLRTLEVFDFYSWAKHLDCYILTLSIPGTFQYLPSCDGDSPSNSPHSDPFLRLACQPKTHVVHLSCKIQDCTFISGICLDE